MSCMPVWSEMCELPGRVDVAVRVDVASAIAERTPGGDWGIWGFGVWGFLGFWRLTIRGVAGGGGGGPGAPGPPLFLWRGGLGPAPGWVPQAVGSLWDGGRGCFPFHSGGSKSLTITVDRSRAYQTMDGFGASITDSSAHVLYTLQGKIRDNAMRDPQRLSLMRCTGTFEHDWDRPGTARRRSPGRFPGGRRPARQAGRHRPRRCVHDYGQVSAPEQCWGKPDPDPMWSRAVGESQIAALPPCAGTRPGCNTSGSDPRTIRYLPADVALWQVPGGHYSLGSDNFTTQRDVPNTKSRV